MIRTQLAQHENFDIAQRPTRDRLDIVREDRIKPADSSLCLATIGGIAYPVLDYSSFGFAIKAAHPFLKPDAQGATFKYGELSFDDLVVKRSYEIHASEGEYRIGFEIIHNSLDVEVIQAYQVSVDLQPEIHEILFAQVDIPAEFRFRTLELKDKLALARAKINEAAEKIYSKQSVDHNVKVENVFGRFFGVYLRDAFSAVLDSLEAVLKPETDEVRQRAMNYFREELQDYIFAAPFVHRVYHKPNGYAGDFEMMNHIYKNEAIGHDLFAKCLHKAILEAPASQAVRNRVAYLNGKIKEAVSGSKSRLKILSVACGPAIEIQNLLRNHPDLAAKADFYLLDQDMGALKQAKTELMRLAKQNNVKFNVNLVNKAIKNIMEDGLGDTYDLIYSAGLFDYFRDKVALLAAKALFEGLNPGGRLIVGNFNTENPSRFLMECVGDWHLEHRSIEAMKALFGKVAPAVEVESESQNINLFAVMRNEKPRTI